MSIFKTVGKYAVRKNDDEPHTSHKKGQEEREQMEVEELKFIFGNTSLILEWFHFILCLQTQIYHSLLPCPFPLTGKGLKDLSLSQDPQFKEN